MTAENSFWAATCSGDTFVAGEGKETHAGVDDGMGRRAHAGATDKLNVCEVDEEYVFLAKTARKTSCFVGDASRLDEDATVRRGFLHA
jgi:hypothetical protein